MNITDVRIRRIEEEGRLKAVVSVTFDGEFVVHDMKIIEGDNGLFVAMPSRKSSDGIYRDIAHPINSQMRGMLQDAILERYQQELADGTIEE
jgi:stage V sporulation protein G